MNLDTAVKFEYVRQYGDNAMAYSTLAEGVLDFTTDGIEGYIAHFTKGRTAFMISDPICPKADIPNMIAAFKQYYNGKRYSVIGLEMGEKSFQGLKDSGFYINDFGFEFDLNLSEFPVNKKGKLLSGKKFEYLRRRYNIAKRAGIEVSESTPSQEDKDEIKDVSDEWLHHKNHGVELLGLTRPLVIEDETDVRYFFAKKDKKMLGFVIWDPQYRDGKILGYYHNFVRFRKDVPNGISILTTVDSLAKFQSEGYVNAFLGQSPLHKMENTHGQQNKCLELIFKMLYNSGTIIYPFKGNAFHKEKYRGIGHKVYAASQKRFPIIDLVQTMRMMKII